MIFIFEKSSPHMMKKYIISNISILSALQYTYNTYNDKYEIIKCHISLDFSHKKTFENVHLMNNHIIKIQIPVINNM